MQNKTINGYKLGKALGTGGMAEVYFAINRLGKKAAVKVLKAEYSQDENIRSRFINEANIIVKLDHPNIRKVLDLGEINGRPAIIMEYLEGQTLKEWTNNRGRAGAANLKMWFEKIADAIRYAHSQQVIHRDIKPSNIFVTQEGEIKLLDFGIAKMNGNETNTVTGQALGTIMYMSPEQVQDPKRVSYPTDFYSLGVTFYHLLTGKPPYDATTDSDFKIQTKIVQQDLDLSKISTDWHAVLAACLVKNPEHRKLIGFGVQNTAFQLITTDETVVEITQQPPIPIEIRPKKKGRKWLLGLLAFGVIGTAIWGFVQDTLSPPIPPKPTMEPMAAATEIDGSMVFVAGDSFTMGCTTEQGEDCYDEEIPPHFVELNGFKINKYEVTQEQWFAIMKYSPSTFDGCNRCPVESVSVEEVTSFIKTLNELSGQNYRLPTEAEWEYAARGGNKSQGYKYAGSNDIDKVSWYKSNSKRKPHEVGKKSSNELGLYDMSGNVYEWCSDFYDKDYYKNGTTDNPKGAANGREKSVRGGAWNKSSRISRVSNRIHRSSDERAAFLGFRLASD